MKRLKKQPSQKMNPMTNEEDDDEYDIDLNFVVDGDFFDGEEFIPVIESDRGHLKMDV